MDAVTILTALVAVVVGFLLGRKVGADAQVRAAKGRLADLVRFLRGEGGQGPSSLPRTGEIQPIAEALVAGWTRKGEEREEAVHAALERLSAFLQVAVEAPLNRALASSAESYRHDIEDALGAIDDLEFFLEEPPEGSGPTDVRAASRKVIREFVESWGITVRELFPDRPVNARLNPNAFMDALFLILHNAAHFSDGQRITVELQEVGHEVHVSVRDRGPGFTAEALLRALDPFYSTSPGGLGMGLPQARRLIESQGGQLRFRNLKEGGAEVTVSFPLD